MKQLALILPICFALFACEASASQQIEATHVITDISRGNSLIIEDADGVEIVLRVAGIRMPQEGEGGYDAAQDYLRALHGIGLTLNTGEGHRDRYERLVASPVMSDGRSLAEIVIGEGFGFAYSWESDPVNMPDLLAAEQSARNANAGLWATSDFAIRSADPNMLALHLETVQIVQGRVISVASTPDRTYLNFGFDYRTDFTVSIEARDIEGFREAGIEPVDLEGREVRVRGWLRAINGPAISIDHPGRLEVLTP